MTAYYNENDPYAAQWLRNLIARGLIAAGDVDARSICDVRHDDLVGYAQCHFFAGIGGWSFALRLAGWPNGVPVWTGSCPCQPFSVAGKKKGFADERHLWPDWFRLIRECHPPVVFGEQVASATIWLDAVFADLEGEDYACGAAILPAAGVGAPHQRDRLWFVADAAFRERRCSDAEIASSCRKNGPQRKVGRLCRDVANTYFDHKFGRGRDVQMGRFQSKNEIERNFNFSGNQWRSEPDVGRVAYGVPARVGKLCALGNAIVPQVAAEFISAFLECRP